MANLADFFAIDLPSGRGTLAAVAGLGALGDETFQSIEAIFLCMLLRHWDLF
jgi:hypothetical protein